MNQDVLAEYGPGPLVDPIGDKIAKVLSSVGLAGTPIPAAVDRVGLRKEEVNRLLDSTEASLKSCRQHIDDVKSVIKDIVHEHRVVYSEIERVLRVAEEHKKQAANMRYATPRGENPTRSLRDSFSTEKENMKNASPSTEYRKLLSTIQKGKSSNLLNETSKTSSSFAKTIHCNTTNYSKN